jgi:hypothetical protein
MVSADGTRAGFAGVKLGRTKVYGVLADAECAQGGRHQCLSRWCDCGFYCLHTLDDARALACDPDYRNTVLLDIAASGRFRRYERGLRYTRQRVSRVRVGRCSCGYPATVFVETGTGSIGWRRLVAVCARCAGPRPGLPLAVFSRLLGDVPVVPDEITWPYDLSTAPATGSASGVTTGAGAGATSPSSTRPKPAVVDEELVPMLTAEIALLQARLDEVQRQLDRLIKR